MNTTELTSRLDAIALEREELARRDFAEELRHAIVTGGDADAAEAAQDQAQRRVERLAIEADALQQHLPAARLADAQPALDAARQRESKAVADARAAADKAMKALGSLEKAMQDYTQANSYIFHDARQEIGGIRKEHNLAGADAPIHEGVHHPVLLQHLAAAKGQMQTWCHITDSLDVMQRRNGSTDIDLTT